MDKVTLIQHQEDIALLDAHMKRNPKGKQRKRFDGLIWKAFFGSSNELHYVTEWAEVE